MEGVGMTLDPFLNHRAFLQLDNISIGHELITYATAASGAALEVTINANEKLFKISYRVPITHYSHPFPMLKGLQTMTHDLKVVNELHKIAKQLIAEHRDWGIQVS